MSALPANIIPAVTRAYDQYRQTGDRKALQRCAAQLGVPKWRVNRLGKSLGLARIKETPWTEEELDLLRSLAPYTPETIQRKMSEAGFPRSVTAIRLKRKRLKLKWLPGLGMSANRLAAAMGVDQHKVGEWIAAGLLRATRRGTARTAQQHGDDHYIEREDIRRFLVQWPDEYPIFRVDHHWFIETILGQRCGDGLDEEHF